MVELKSSLRNVSRMWGKHQPKLWRDRRAVIAHVRLSGVIAERSAMRSALNLKAVAGALEKAFKMRARAVALSINSPGGSPVQSNLIFRRIRALAREHDKRVYVFVEDVAASGGYWIACAGDEIIADPASIVGSIGVVHAGFGFEALIDKIGIERRLHHTGDKKAMLDPFSPQKPEDVNHLMALQGDIYTDFCEHVRQCRGAALKADEETLFSGAFWTARRGMEFGLVDRLGVLRDVMREKYGDKVKIRDVSPSRSFLGRFTGAAARAPVAREMTGEVMTALHERALWARFGL